MVSENAHEISSILCLYSYHTNFSCWVLKLKITLLVCHFKTNISSRQVLESDFDMENIPNVLRFLHFQNQNKAQRLDACGHVSASNQSLRLIFSLSLYSSFLTSRPGWPKTKGSGLAKRAFTHLHSDT